MTKRSFRSEKLLAAIAFGGFAISPVLAQTTAPANGPDGRNPAIAPTPEATATSPGTRIGPAVRTTSPGSSGPGYGVVAPDASPGPGARSVDPAVAPAPGSDASSPGTSVVPVDESLPRQSLPAGTPGARGVVGRPSSSGVAPRIPSQSPTVPSIAPAASPAQIRAPTSVAPNPPSPGSTP